MAVLHLECLGSITSQPKQGTPYEKGIDVCVYLQSIKHTSLRNSLILSTSVLEDGEQNANKTLKLFSQN